MATLSVSALLEGRLTWHRKPGHQVLLALMLGLCALLYAPLPQAVETSADQAEDARLFRLLSEPENSEEYGAFIADLTIQIMLEEHQKRLLFVPGETYAANSSPQSSFGRFLVEKYRQNWNDAMNDLVGMLTRRSWLAAALSPQGARIPMSMEAENGMPLIGYIWPLLNQRDASVCEVERNQAARCYATISLQRNRPGDYAIRQMTITDGEGQTVALPNVSTLAKEFGGSTP